MTVTLREKHEVEQKTMFGETVIHTDFTSAACDECDAGGYVHIHYYEFQNNDDLLCKDCAEEA